MIFTAVYRAAYPDSFCNAWSYSLHFVSSHPIRHILLSTTCPNNMWLAQGFPYTDGFLDFLEGSAL